MWSLVGLLVAVIFVMVLSTRSARRTRPAISEAVARDGGIWTLGKGSFEGRPMIMRVRTDLAALDRGAYAERLTVAWTFGEDGFDGFPSDAASEEMTLFEDRLIPALEDDTTTAEP